MLCYYCLSIKQKTLKPLLALGLLLLLLYLLFGHEIKILVFYYAQFDIIIVY